MTVQDANIHFQNLANLSTYHALTHDVVSSDQFRVDNRYSERFHGIMLGTGASYSSVVGFGQVQAYIADFDPHIDATNTGNLTQSLALVNLNQLV